MRLGSYNDEYSDDTRIVGGEVTAGNPIPWHGGLVRRRSDSGWQKRPYCGGTIICPRFVLTAAHCVDAPKKGLVDATMELKKTGKAQLIAVLAGEFDLKDDGDKAPPDTW